MDKMVERIGKHISSSFNIPKISKSIESANTYRHRTMLMLYASRKRPFDHERTQEKASASIKKKIQNPYCDWGSGRATTGAQSELLTGAIRRPPAEPPPSHAPFVTLPCYFSESKSL